MNTYLIYYHSIYCLIYHKEISDIFETCLSSCKYLFAQATIRSKLRQTVSCDDDLAMTTLSFP